MLDLGLVGQRGQLRAEIRHDLANRGDRPRYVMFLLQQTMHRFLRVLSGPLSEAISQGERGFAADDAQTHLQRKKTDQADAGIAGLITNALQGNGAEPCADALAARRPIPASIDVVVEVPRRSCLFGILRLKAIEDRLQDPPSDFVEQSHQIEFERMGSGWSDEAGLKKADRLAHLTDQGEQFHGQRQERRDKWTSLQHVANVRKRHQASFPGLGGLATPVSGRMPFICNTRMSTTRTNQPNSLVEPSISLKIPGVD